MHSVLVVDDYADTRELLYAVLSGRGYEVSLAADGAEGVRVARDTRPAVIIMDVFMPVMDGIEATRRIKAQPETAHTRVIAYSARHAPGDAKNELFDAVCPKPCSPDELLALIRDVVPS